MQHLKCAAGLLGILRVGCGVLRFAFCGLWVARCARESGMWESGSWQLAEPVSINSLKLQTNAQRGLYQGFYLLCQSEERERE